MTLGVVGVSTRPLHELEAAWKAEGQLAVAPTELVARPCLCGGVITAMATELAITRAVSVHNASTAHARAMVALGWR